MNEHVASNLKSFREKLGWTQEHLAAAADISVRTVQRAEKDGDLGAETLLALAAVFEISVADLQRPSTSAEGIGQALAEAKKRYKLISLTRIERASDLRAFMGAHGWQVDHVTGLSDEQEDEIALFEELLKDYGDIWSDIEPTQQREAVKTIFESVSRLQASGLCVAAGLDPMRLTSAGASEPWTMNILRVLVSSVAEPNVVLMRHRNVPVQFQ